MAAAAVTSGPPVVTSAPRAAATVLPHPAVIAVGPDPKVKELCDQLVQLDARTQQILSQSQLIVSQVSQTSPCWATTNDTLRSSVTLRNSLATLLGQSRCGTHNPASETTLTVDSQQAQQIESQEQQNLAHIQGCGTDARGNQIPGMR